MDCKECELNLVDYVAGDLSEELASVCRSHLQTCASCRQSLAQYASVVEAIAGEPEALPSASESAALAAALDCVRPRIASPRPATAESPQGFAAFLLSSFAVFVLMIAALVAQAFGVIDVVSVAGSVGPARIALAWVIIVFVTSFIPIVVTARRRPLNGLTFRK